MATGSINYQLSSLSSTQQSVAWRSPSNIAIVKYWGKHGIQLPRNPSVSFTLDAAHTDTKVSFTEKIEKDGEVSIDFYFEGAPNEAFANKIIAFLQSLHIEFSFLLDYDFKIESSNSFPHSSGIASSASAMSALALCFCSIEKILTGWPTDASDFLNKASHIARLGSGSAARSVFPEVAIWGTHSDIEGSTDLQAIPFDSQLHKSFKRFHDDILIVSADEKSVSSRAGHSLMEVNPYATVRYEQANKNMMATLEALKTGDILSFGKILEEEAMTLHALMMCSDPSYVLMKAGTLAVVEKVRAFREETSLPLYFTLDAGPNVHLLYPDEVEDQIWPFIERELVPHCVDGKVIRDRVGSGPRLI
ncbi:MAG: diphosphomevalonate decarboxylase [Saprospirales bacterium]|nr:diphosphomevalonate decarboxylase [Saprospirales bacterium]HAI56680.1 diphosphomevalonate decarboxylase [Saprospirales bacterium]|tara:strand:- start:556 stop:1641 length:1086 start_codon:yes stop_codon:yes gene_type:complete